MSCWSRHHAELWCDPVSSVVPCLHKERFCSNVYPVFFQWENWTILNALDDLTKRTKVETRTSQKVRYCYNVPIKPSSQTNRESLKDRSTSWHPRPNPSRWWHLTAALAWVSFLPLLACQHHLVTAPGSQWLWLSQGEDVGPEQGSSHPCGQSGPCTYLQRHVPCSLVHLGVQPPDAQVAQRSASVKKTAHRFQGEGHSFAYSFKPLQCYNVLHILDNTGQRNLACSRSNNKNSLFHDANFLP